MRLTRLPRAYWSLRRYREILAVLIKYGFGDLLETLRVRHPLVGKLPRLKALKGLEGLSRPERLRLAFEELGPSFVKLGQLLGLRPDLVPSEYSQELAKLQDEVTPFPFVQARERIEGQLGQPLEELFAEFEQEPLAAASLAQVHRALLKDGKEAVVKVQRPGIRDVIRADLIILQDLAQFIAHYVPESEPYDPLGTVRQFSKTLSRELDFVREGRNMELFRRNFSADKTIHVPEVFWELTCSEVLTIERIEGIKVSDLEALERAGLDRRQIALNGANATLKQVFEHGFFHADPHPGNVRVLEGNVIAPLDFGMVGRLDENLKQQLGELLVGIVRRDIGRMVRGLRELGSLGDQIDLRAFRVDLADLVDRYYKVPLLQLDLGQLLEEMLAVMGEHRVRLPASLVMMSKALVIEEGVGRALDPELDMIGLAQPYVQRLVFRRLFSRRELRDWAAVLEETNRFLKELPGGLRSIMGRISRGEFRTQFEHLGLDRLITEMDRASNRLSFALIIGALIVGSSLVMQLEAGPRLWGVPLFGLLGFGIAAVLGFWLAVAILRSGRL